MSGENPYLKQLKNLTKLSTFPYMGNFNFKEEKLKLEKDRLEKKKLIDYSLNSDPNSKNTLGLKFELFLYILLKKNSLHNVTWNVEYKKAPRVFRQIDLEYTSLMNKKPMKVLVEAKYTTNQKINYWLRSEKNKNSPALDIQLDNLVNEVLERQEFVGGKSSTIITNAQFDSHIHSIVDFENKKHKSKYGFNMIDLIEGKALFKNYQKLGGFKKTLNEAILSIDVNKFKPYLEKTSRNISNNYL